MSSLKEFLMDKEIEPESLYKAMKVRLKFERFHKAMEYGIIEKGSQILTKQNQGSTGFLLLID